MPTRPARERFAEKYLYDQETGCWNWTDTPNSAGYGTFRQNSERIDLAHRYSYEHYRAPIEPGQVVLHRCDNPLCVNPAHLMAGTQSDNMIDASRKGRHGLAKLDADKVRHIRQGVMSRSEYATLYGVTCPAIRLVQIGKTYAWVEDEE